MWVQGLLGGKYKYVNWRFNSTTQHTIQLKYEIQPQKIKKWFHVIISAGYPLVVKGLNAPLEIG